MRTGAVDEIGFVWRRKMVGRSLRLSVLCALALCRVTAAAAQDNSVSVGIGYQFLRLDERSFPLGVDADVVGRLTQHFALVGDLAWSRDAAQQFGLRDVATALYLGGGAKWTGNPTGRLRPFAQMSVGVERDTTAIEQFGSDSVASFTIRPGAGIVVDVNRWQSLFGQIDIRRVFRESDAATAIGVVAGVRFNVR